MITFPNAKINLGLHILNKRKDGYHDIESCFYPAPIADVLEVVPANTFSFQTSGLKIDGNSSDNLVLKAYSILRKHRNLPSVSMHLHKVIPMGAGLGGGSSDGAYALKMLNEALDLNLTSIQLNALAAELGSDCPFFIKNRPSIATGRGTAVEPLELNLSDYRIDFKHPNVHISTGEAYSMVKPKRRRKKRIKDILQLPVAEWQGQLINDFEEPSIQKYPEIGKAKTDLLDQGAIYVSMTGSGSTVFGLFPR